MMTLRAFYFVAMLLVGQSLYAMQPYDLMGSGRQVTAGQEEVDMSMIPARSRILLISVHPPYGGGSAHSSKELATGLRSLGHDVLHIAPYNHNQEDKLTQEPGLHWIKADFPWNSLTITPEAQATMDGELKAAYQKFGPFDYVILGRETFVWHIDAVREVHKGPIALIIRGAYINRLAGNTNETIDPALKSELIGLYRKADVIICIARHLVNSINEVIFGGRPESERTTVFIPNPIKLPPFHENNQLAAPGQRVRVAMAAQIKSRKRPLDAVEIVRLLVARGVDVELTVFGDGPDMGKMKALIERHNLGANIILRGHVNRAEVLAAFDKVETVLLCSDNEGWPRVLQEAIAAGKGIVAYDNIGSREVLQNWVSPWPLGRLAPIGDTQAAADAIFDLAQYLRSNTQVVRPPQLPDSVEVLHQYETVLRAAATR